jgi:predicted DNA-binding WGR domain protein
MRWTHGRRTGSLEIMDSPAPLHLHRIDPGRNMARFYSLEITPSLFGDHALLRRWGRIGHKGRQMIELHGDRDSVMQAFLHYATQKQRRGYRPFDRDARSPIRCCASLKPPLTISRPSL